MNIPTHHKLIIIGSGPAGLTAGIYAARGRLAPIIIQGSNPGGQLVSTTYVNNWPGEINILGHELMNKIHNHAVNLGCTFIAQTVIKANFSDIPYSITTHRNQILTADTFIIATGSIPKRLGCPGEDRYWGKGVTSCAVCDAALYHDKRVVIVGGGDTAMEFLYALLKYTQYITIVHILDTLTASPSLQQQLYQNKSIVIHYNSTVTAIHGDATNVTGVTITNNKTKQSTYLEVSGIFLAIGLTPNTQVFANQLALDDYGYIQTTNNTHTSKRGIFAAGDVIDARYRQAITSAASGCMAAIDVQHYLTQKHI